MTLPDDWNEAEIAAYIQEHHSGPENAGREYAICEALHISDRRFREWKESQRKYPIAATDKGVWFCTCKRDWFPCVRYRVRCFLAARKGMYHTVWMMKNHHPKSDQLFDDEQYGRAA